MVNEWTRDDLPKVFEDSRRPGRPWNPSPDLMSDLATWLNEHHPKPGMDRSGVDWKAMYEPPGRERDDAYAASALFQRDVHAWRTRAEAAEARTAPAVTRDEVEKAIRDNEHRVNDDGFMHHEVNITEAADAVCRLFGVEAEPADPVEAKAQEWAEIMWPDAHIPEGDAAVDALCRLIRHLDGQEGRHVD